MAKHGLLGGIDEKKNYIMLENIKLYKQFNDLSEKKLFDFFKKKGEIEPFFDDPDDPWG